MKFKADRSRLDIADPGQEQAGDDLSIGQSPFNPGGDLFKDAFARGILQESYEWFNLWMEANYFRRQGRLSRRYGWELSEETKVAQAGESCGGGADF